MQRIVETSSQSSPTDVPPLEADSLTVGYGDRPVLIELDAVVPAGSFTVVVGPNASGKSTLLRTLARLLDPASGKVLLDGRPIDRFPSKEVARRMALLPQNPVAPDGITVTDLVARGRFPHQRLLRQWSADDERAVAVAMEATDVVDLADCEVHELSGGQRQRVWLAMALAQETSILLLDEPTTFLDIAHQIDVLDLCRSLHQDSETTLVAVLHDLNHACRYATNLIVMSQGQVAASGDPAEVITAELVEDVFSLECMVIPDPSSGTPMVIPIDRRPR